VSKANAVQRVASAGFQEPFVVGTTVCDCPRHLTKIPAQPIKIPVCYESGDSAHDAMIPD
jgi:hypothetical protein